MAKKKSSSKPPSPADIDRRTGVTYTAPARPAPRPAQVDRQTGVTYTAPARPAPAAPSPAPAPAPAPAAAPVVETPAAPANTNQGGIATDPNATAGQVNTPAPATAPVPEGAGTPGGILFQPMPAEEAAPVSAPAPMEEAPAEPAGPTAEQTSAYDLISQALTSYGLEGLGDFVNDLVFNQGITSQDALRTQIRQTEQYQTRFAANINRRNRGLTWIDEGVYLGLENDLIKTLRDAGMPAGFYDSIEDVDQFIELDISPQELAERIEQGYDAINRADPEVIGAMRRLYGVGDGELAAYFLDPERAQTVLLRQARSAQIAGQAQRQARMEIGVGLAEQLEREGITEQQARQGFSIISDLGEVFQTTAEEAGAGQQAFTQEEQVGAVFQTSAAAQQRLRQRQRQRTAAFEAGGRFAGQGAEVTGLR